MQTFGSALKAADGGPVRRRMRDPFARGSCPSPRNSHISSIIWFLWITTV
jgi:hypothetical protein